MPVAPIAEEILTGKVLARVVARIEENANSFQANMKQNRHVAAMPPLTIGSNQPPESEESGIPIDQRDILDFGGHAVKKALHDPAWPVQD